MNSVETLSYQCRVVKTVEILVENDPAMPISELLNVLPFALLYNVSVERLLVSRLIHLRSDWQTLL